MARAIVRRSLTQFAPDCLSLHFVCYGVDRRGLVSRVAPYLREMLRGWPMHVFLHELWVGAEIGTSWRSKFIGWAQRRGVVALLRALDVRLVHTSNADLRSPAGAAAWRIGHAACRSLGRCRCPRSELSGFGEKSVTLAWFGTLHPVWPAEPLFSHLRSFGRPISCVHAGHIGAGADLWEALRARYGEHFEFRRLGELPPQELADFLGAA